MAIGIYSGKDAAIDGVACVQSWGLALAVTQSRYAASCLGDGTNTPAGPKNWTGQMAGLGAHPADAFPDGVAIEFIGCVNNDEGQGDLHSVEAAILVEQLTININKNDGSPISWEATFGVNGEPNEIIEGVEDSAPASSESGSDLDIKIGGVTIEAAHLAVQTAQIVFRRAPSTFIRGGLTERRPGNLECDINFAVSCPQLSIAAYEENALARVQIYTGASSYWDLSKIRFGGKSGYTVGRGSPSPIIGYSVTGQWNAKDGATDGWIAYYDGSSWTDYQGEHGT